MQWGSPDATQNRLLGDATLSLDANSMAVTALSLAIASLLVTRMSSKHPLYTSALFWMPSEVQNAAADTPTGVLSQSLNTADILKEGATGAATGATTVTLTATGATTGEGLGAGAALGAGAGAALGAGAGAALGAGVGAALGAGAGAGVGAALGAGAGAALGTRSIDTNKLRPSVE